MRLTWTCAASWPFVSTMLPLPGHSKTQSHAWRLALHIPPEAHVGEHEPSPANHPPQHASRPRSHGAGLAFARPVHRLPNDPPSRGRSLAWTFAQRQRIHPSQSKRTTQNPTDPEPSDRYVQG